MKKIKISALAVAAVLTVSALAACKTTTPQTSKAPETSKASETTAEATVTPTPVITPKPITEVTPIPTPDNTVTEELLSDAWKASKTEHWHVTVSGKKADVGNHNFVEDECTVCGCSVIEGDDYVFIAIFNDNYDIILHVEYEGDGDEPTYFIETEYTYDGEMNILTHKSTNFGKPYEDGKYSYATFIDDFFGEEFTYTYCSELTKYSEGGSKTVELYNENELITKSTTYDAMGAITAENSFEYTHFEDGFVKSIKKYVGERLVLETVYSSIDEGHMIIKQIVYNEDGTKTEWDVLHP